MHHSLLSLDPHLVTCFIVFQIMRENENLIWVPGSLEYKWPCLLHLAHLKFTFKCQMTNLPTGSPDSWEAHTGGSLKASAILCSACWAFVAVSSDSETPWPAALQASLSFISQFAQAHVHWVNDAIQPSPPHPFFCPFPASGSFPLSWLFAWGGKYWKLSTSSPFIVCRFLLLVRLFATSWTVTR